MQGRNSSVNCGGGGDIHVFVLCSTKFEIKPNKKLFSIEIRRAEQEDWGRGVVTQHFFIGVHSKNNRFEKKLVG